VLPVCPHAGETEARGRADDAPRAARLLVAAVAVPRWTRQLLNDMEVICADCGCRVDRGVVVARCERYPECCCGDLPVRSPSWSPGSGAGRMRDRAQQGSRPSVLAARPDHARRADAGAEREFALVGEAGAGDERSLATCGPTEYLGVDVCETGLIRNLPHTTAPTRSPSGSDRWRSRAATGCLRHRPSPDPTAASRPSETGPAAREVPRGPVISSPPLVPHRARQVTRRARSQLGRASRRRSR